MHTGYDNFWMYQNNRHEPVLNLPKNDNYSQAVLTDSYKQVQNGGRPSHLNSYISPQNNVASSHQIKQQRIQDSNCLWPSSVYSMPLKFSSSRNVLPQEAFLTQPINAHYLSSNCPTHQNYDFRYFKNSNVHVSQMYKNNNNTNNYNNLENSGLARDNENAKAQSQRIRVKDVFSLNNNTVYYQFLTNNVHQTYAKEPQKCALNCPTVNYTTPCTSDTQSEVINYGKNSITVPQSTYYGHTTATEQLPQYLQNSGSFYQQTAEYSPETQFQFSGGRVVKQNLQLEASKTNSSIPLLRQLLYSRNIQEPKRQIEGSHSDSVYGNTRIKIIQQRHSVPINNLEMTNNSGYASSLEVNTGLIHKTSNLNNVTRIQHEENFTRINVACLPTSSSAAALTSNSVKNITSGHSYAQTSGQEDAIVKVSYPHNFQSTSMSINDFNNRNKNSNVSLPFLLESNDLSILKKNSLSNSDNNTRENEITSLPETSQGNFGNSQAPCSVRSSPVLAHNCQTAPRKRLCPKEPFINLNKENVTNFLDSDQTCENTPENLSAVSGNGGEVIPREAMMQNCPSNDLALKPENYNGNMESPCTANHISEGKVLFEIIKTEENSVDENPEDFAMEEYEAQSTEKLDDLTESFVVDEDTYFPKVDVDEFVLPSEKSQSVHSDMEDDVTDCRGVDNFNINSVTENKIEGDDAETTEVVGPKKNYESKINRDKLDMLIQFLEADEPIETKFKPTCKKIRRSDSDGKKEIDLNHNRRKLNKTRIVRNKNNSREMISYKIARVEPQRSSSQPSQILKPNSSKMEEGKYSKAEDRLKNISLIEQELSSKPSPEKNSKIQDEQNFLRTMRALQTLKTHFCVGCGLVSPIDSFWINVASGELRCFNCFSKVAVKGRQNALKSKHDDRGNFECKSIPMGQAEKGFFEWVTENNVKATDKSNGLFKAENADAKPINAMKESINHKLIPEERQIEGKNTKKKGMESPHTFRKQSASSENKTPEKGRSWEDQKKLTTKHPVKINKSKEVTASHKAKHSEDTPAVDVKEKKGGDSSSQYRKRNNSKDSKFLEELTKKEEKRGSDLSDKSVKKTKDSHISHKDNSEEQIIKKNAKHELSERSKTQSLSVESDTCQKSKPSGPAKPKELNSLGESKKRGRPRLNSLEKHKKTDQMQLRKRKNSEDVGSNKICILEDSTRREKVPIKITSVLKESSGESKNKTLDNEGQINSEERSRKNSLSKEDGDHTKKETKQVLHSKMKDVLQGDATNQKMKTCGQAKQKTSDKARASKDEQPVSPFDKQRGGNTSREGSKSPVSSLQELCKKGTRYECSYRKKAEEKEKKNPSGKAQKNSSSEKDHGDKVVTSNENAGHPPKSDAASKPPKEDQNDKVRSATPGANLKNKESHLERKEIKKHAEGRKDEKMLEKNFREKGVTNSDKKKDGERLERTRCDNSQALTVSSGLFYRD